MIPEDHCRFRFERFDRFGHVVNEQAQLTHVVSQRLWRAWFDIRGICWFSTVYIGTDSKKESKDRTAFYRHRLNFSSSIDRNTNFSAIDQSFIHNREQQFFTQKTIIQVHSYYQSI